MNRYLLGGLLIAAALAVHVTGLPPESLLGVAAVGMTTLAADKPRAYAPGTNDSDDYLVIASDIIYEGAAVGFVGSSGYARPLVAGDRFAGFAESRANNASGAAGDKSVRVRSRGEVKLPVSGAVITDVGQPVYAADDDTFQFSPVGGTFVGRVKRFISAGVVIVEFDAFRFADPYAEYGVRELISANKTLDAEDSGKLFWVDTDAVTITLPAVAVGSLCKIVNGGAYGAVAVTISPDANDSIEAPDITAADNKDIINTKATARRGDAVTLGDANADGYIVTNMVGIWARQA